MKIDFEGKTVLVTGAGNGIGKEIAITFLNLNATVVVTGRGSQPKWCDNYPKCIFTQLDFLESSSIKNIQHELENHENIDILINNAGIQIKHEIGDIKDSDWNKVIEVNLTGPMKMMRMVLPKMKSQLSGHILNISSVAGIISKPEQSSYSASKFGLIGLTKSSALDLAKYNIKVNALCPGTTHTSMVDEILDENQKNLIRNNIPYGRFADISEVANMTVMLCSQYNTYMTGETIILDGGFTIQ